jgi:hypothetical protein
MEASLACVAARRAAVARLPLHAIVHAPGLPLSHASARARRPRACTHRRARRPRACTVRNRSGEGRPLEVAAARRGPILLPIKDVSGSK